MIEEEIMNSKLNQCMGCTHGHTESLRRDFSRYKTGYTLINALKLFVFHPGFRTVCEYRILAHLYSTRRFRLSSLYRIRILKRYGADFVPGVTIGMGLRIEHPSGIVVGRGVVIGDDFTIMHNVTIGQREIDLNGLGLSPQISNGVTVAAGATLVGSVHVKDNVFIKTGSLIIGNSESQHKKR
jgi:serine O-acetyltransferase